MFKRLQDILTEWVGQIPAASSLDFWSDWKPLFVLVTVWLALVILAFISIKRIGYRIGKKYFMVTLYGIPVRWISFDNIRTIHPHRTRFSEKWRNQIFSSNDRVLTIAKRTGILKHLEISPEQRYVFKAELDRAIRARLGLPPAATAADTTTFEKMAADEGRAAGLSQQASAAAK